MAHTFGNDLQIAITRSSLIIQALEKHTLTPTDCLGYIEKSVDPVNRLVAMLEVFTTEENLFSYAKILSASNIKERQELATLINTNADFRKQFANIAMQCYSYVKRQRDNLQEIEVYFKKRDINSQIRHLVPAEDL